MAFNAIKKQYKAVFDLVDIFLPNALLDNVNQLVQEIIDGLHPSKNIQINLKNKLPIIAGDHTHYTQIFQNLIGNAIDYNDKPKGIIDITCTEQENNWLFAIADNGPGIDKKYHNKIFQIFQTLAPRDETESTGIGLTVVKKIVELNGGEITVESESGKGSVFSFTLPKTGD